MKTVALMLLVVGLSLTHASRAAETSLAIVAQDGVTLLAQARTSAPRHAILWQGESLEVRGQVLDYLQVYDHRIERAGFVRASQVRIVSLKPDAAPDLLAVVRFLRDLPGSESLGIAYTAAYLRAAPTTAIGPEPFAALGTMAQRLAERASANTRKSSEERFSGQLEVAAEYGVTIKSIDRDGKMRLCYDGDAFRRVMALNARDLDKAHAALALTESECVDPKQTPIERAAYDTWRADLIARVAIGNLPTYMQNRLHMRAASVWSAIVFEQSRRNEPTHSAAQRAIAELTAVNAHELGDEDRATYNNAAIRVGASRWAAEPPKPESKGLRIVTRPGQPGETCITLLDGKHDEKSPLARRCTYATVWANSARINAHSTALALAVQPMSSWRELWLFRKNGSQWTIDVVPPAYDDPQLGYIEFAGWVPGDKKMLAARETRVDGRFIRRFEILDMRSLAALKHADQPSSLSGFYRWQDPTWKSQTVSLRE